MKSQLRNIKEHFEFESNPFLEGDLWLFALAFLIGAGAFGTAFLIKSKLLFLLGSIGCTAVNVTLVFPTIYHLKRVKKQIKIKKLGNKT